MNLTQLLDEIDQQIQQGDLIGAVDRFFSDDCQTFSTGADVTRGKAEKIQSLHWFFKAMARTNRIDRVNALVDGDISYSEFIFDFIDQNGQNHNWHEVIRRRWENGKVIEEQYFTNLSNENPMAQLATQSKASEKPAAKKAPAKNPAAKPALVEKPAAPKTAVKKSAAPKTEEPVVEMPERKKPTVKKTSAKKTTEPTTTSEKPAAKSKVSKKAASDNTDASAESAPVKKTSARKKS